MKPRRFVEIKARTDPALKRVHETFADPDKLTVTSADIETMAQTLAESFELRNSFLHHFLTQIKYHPLAMVFCYPQCNDE